MKLETSLHVLKDYERLGRAFLYSLSQDHSTLLEKAVCHRNRLPGGKGGLFSVQSSEIRPGKPQVWQGRVVAQTETR